MITNAERKEHPVSMRLSEVAVLTAEDVLMENGLIRMSAKGFADFIKVLSGPATQALEIVELVRRPAPWEPGYGAKS